jgi:TonB-linked SusC/RagA family outer membrane protein
MKCFPTVLRKPFQSKVLLIMKLTSLFILLFALNVSANGFGQDRISLRLKKTELGGVLRSIEKQTNYRFLYNNNLEDIREKVSINVKEAGLSDVLSLLLDKTRLLYQVMDNNLIIIKEDPNAPVRVPDVAVHGKVTGEGGAALSGVSVQLKGSTTGTTTNIEGSFTLTLPDANGTLVFSSVGYDNKEVTLGGRTDITVSLTTSTKTIDEVVVIGYGTANKRDLTGSIAKISGKEVADKPNTNPIASLQGKVAGLSVVNNGTPGAAPDIRIRGTVSLGQVHPLYVVDGIFNDNIDYINPNDIESIEILKDPSSLAIFGVKGATGVIAITTKKAKAGQTLINFNVSHGFKKLVDKIQLANADQFKELYAEERANIGITDPYDYTGLTANTDWIDAVTRKGQFGAYNLSVSGSTEKNRFNFGLGYTSDEGIIRHEKLEKALLSFSDEFKVSKAIKFGINLNASRTNNPYDATWVLDAARKVVPMVSAGTQQFFVKDPYSTDSLNMDIYSALNTGLQTSGVVNPLIQLENEWNKTINIEYRTVGSAFVELNFLKNFTFRSTFYADMSTVNKRQYTPIYYSYNPVNNTPSLASQITRLQEDDNTYRKFQQDHILTYRKSFGDHNVTATAGFTTYYFGNFNRSGKSSQASGPAALPIPDDKRFWYVNAGLFTDPSSLAANSSQSEYSTVSGLARVLYNYKGKYYLNGSIRNDASSRLPPSSRNQIFWATGAAWELTKENFMTGQHIFDFLKLKGSIGVLGNQSAVGGDGVTPINYPFYPVLRTGVNAVFGTNVFSAASPEWVANPNLKWETVHANEIGVELNAFQNRLHFEGNYFNRTTKDLMTFVDRSSLGIPNELINGGSIRNWGEELMATWTQNVSRDLTLTIGGNITFIKNKVLSLTPDNPIGKLMRGSQNNNSAQSITEPGLPIAYFYGYVVEGVYQSYADVLASPNAAAVGGAHPGDLKFKDINGPDGKGPDGKITADDRTLIGNPTPKFTYGSSISVNYKGLSLGVDVGGVYGNQVFRSWGSLESGFQRVNYPAYKLGRWNGAGTSNWDPILDEGHAINKNGSSYNIEDGSYFRIRNIQLSYSFAKNMISRAFMKDLRVFVNVQNLKTWKNNSGYTAEFGGDATSFGYDVAGGAIPVVSTIGLNVTF